MAVDSQPVDSLSQPQSQTFGKSVLNMYWVPPLIGIFCTVWWDDALLNMSIVLGIIHESGLKVYGRCVCTHHAQIINVLLI